MCVKIFVGCKHMGYCKLQIGCLIVIIYISIIYIRDCRKYKKDLNNTLFDEILTAGFINLILDGTTAISVNYLDAVPPVINTILHLCFLISIDTVVFLVFLYMLKVTGAFPKKTEYKLLVFAPYIANVITVVLSIGSLEYKKGNATNYSTGFPVYACFVMVAVYLLATVITYVTRMKHIESRKRMGIFTYLIAMMLVGTIQLFIPEVLMTGLCITIFIIGMYLNLEDPALSELSHYHDEMVSGFANLVENRDDSTGGHIKRTGMYVKIIAEELQTSGKFSDILTKDYMNNLTKAAPMHDIGKIAVPDAILCKPGRLTDEEYEIMKQHTVKGGKIIEQTFGNLGNEEYRDMAYNVAMYHHEKWNGKGYPIGLSENNIPLCARIMAIADVFDAVSEKRCYRDAMPMDKCFGIIESGRGTDFDPVVTDAFLAIRDKIEMIHSEFLHSETENTIE